jgi:segregation and condensation protein A
MSDDAAKSPMEGVREELKRADGYVVELPSFEGPLDLLLHLIQKHELEILDIPVSFITEKYLEYINLMQHLSIDVASEYLVMAATLAYIKSRTLLPPETAGPEDEIDEDGIDPRAELIRRLLEYQKYKQAGVELSDRGTLGRDVFLRGTPAPEAEGPAPLAPPPVWSLLDAFAQVLARAKVDLDHEVSFERMSITERIQELCDRLVGRASCRFDELFEGQRTRFDLVITFLALLEMTRLKMTRVYQSDALAEIFIELSTLEPAPAGDVAEQGLVASGAPPEPANPESEPEE